MKFNKQLFRHLPDEGEYGDCHRTAIACVLDLEPQDVPHFYGDPEIEISASQKWIEDWLGDRGLMTIDVAYVGTSSVDEVLQSVAYLNQQQPGMLYLLGGKSALGTGHTVVCQGDKIIWDPSQVDSGIVGPMSDGFYWISFFGSTLATAEVV